MTVATDSAPATFDMGWRSSLRRSLWAVLLRIPLAAKETRITEIISRIGQTQPNVRYAQVDGGKLSIRLTEHPVFIEERKNQ